MQAAYIRLHELGWAHSIETWMEGNLVGGLYGLAIGRVFFGESMFSQSKDASKIALTHLARFLSTRQFGMIDCQMYTPHLASLGGHEIVGDEFSHLLAKLIDGSQTPQHWPENACNFDWGKA
jgi:leucyl/phenylalanyl-tRNA--protein transferase